MSTDASNSGGKSRMRFSMRGMLLLVTVWAAALFGWRTFIYEPPTHKIPLYEKASSTRRLSARIGPNQISIRRIARNRRDGNLSIEDGRGVALANGAITNPQALAQAASWLDIVQIELDPGPDLLDIFEVRIFDHQTRTMLTDGSPCYGWQVLKPNLLQLYGIGKELPSKVDVWLRFHSYDAKDEITKLQPTIGSTCKLPTGTVKLDDIRSGSWAYDSRKSPRLHLMHDDNHNAFTTVISWQGISQVRDYQIAAVSRDGKKAHTDYPHFLRGGSQQATRVEPIDFRMPLDEVDHFEIRPFGGRHRFFFEAVQLPKATGQGFAPPPTAVLAIAGKETTVEIPDFAPLSAQLSTYRGDWASGSQSSGTWVSITPREGGATNLEEEFTAVYYMKGIGQVPWNLRFRDSTAGAMQTESDFSRRANGSSRGSVLQAGYKSFQKPLGQVEEIEVTLQPSP